MVSVVRWLRNRGGFAIALFTGAIVLNGCAPKFNFRESSLQVDSVSGPLSYQLVFSTQPTSSISAGEALPTGGVIEVQDNNGNLITTGALASATVSLSDASGNGNIAGVTSVTASGGIATIPNNTLMFEKAGTTNLGAAATVGDYGTLTGTSGTISIATPAFGSVSIFSGVDDPNGDVDADDTSARLDNPQAITTDGTYIYVLEDGSCLIRRYEIASPYTVDTWMGTRYDCDDGTNLVNSGYSSLASDGSTYVYFGGWGRIRQAKISDGTTVTIAGTGSPGYNGDNTTGVDAQVETGEGQAMLVYSGNLYFADGSCRIREVSLTSPYAVTTIAGNGTCADEDGTGASAEVNIVTAMAADANYLYFADTGGGNAYVRTFQWSNSQVTTVKSVGDDVNGIAVSGSDIYITHDDAIYEGVIGTWSFSVVAGSPFTPGEVDGTSGTLMTGGQSQSLVMSGSTIYFADQINGALRAYNTSTGDVTTLAGTSDSGEGWTMNATAANTRFWLLTDVVSDGTALYGYDEWKHQFPVISLSDGSTGTAQGSSWSLSASSNEQQDLAMIGSTLYFNYGCQIYETNPPTWTKTLLVGSSCGEAEGSFASAKFEGVGAIATDHQSHLYVMDNDAIKVIDLNAQTVSVLSGSPGSSGCTTGSSSASRYQGTDYMTYLNGKLYFSNANCGGNEIYQVDTSSGESTVYAGNGTLGFQNGALSNAEFGGYCYTGMPITTDGENLYVGDYSNGLVREIDVGSGTISTLYGNTSDHYETDASLSSATEGTADACYGHGLYYGYGKLYLTTVRGIRVVQ